MPTVQMNKRFGLQKLKKIAGKDPRWAVSPHMVITSPRQFRLAKATGAPRLVIRTDEAGKRYKFFDWNDVPRYEVTPDRVSVHPDLLESAVRKDLRTAGLRVNRHYENLAWRIRYIMHPTRPRASIKNFGVIEVSKEGSNRVTIRLTTGAASEHDPYHRKQVHNSVEFAITDNKWEQTTRYGALLNPQLLRNVQAFIVKGIQTHQIKPGRTREISFLTWTDAPTKPEFFDLIEERKRPDKKSEPSE